jgi:hypothetical protein
VVTALAVTFVPLLEQQAKEAGQPPPPSELRDRLRSDGWRWLLYEVVAVVLFSLLSMLYDHFRVLKKPPQAATIPSSEGADDLREPQPPAG